MKTTNPYAAYNNGQPFPGQLAIHSPKGIVSTTGLQVVMVKLNKKRTNITLTYSNQHPVTVPLLSEYSIIHAATKYMFMVYGKRNVISTNMVWAGPNTIAVAILY